HRAEITAVIRAADSNAMNADQRLVRTGRIRFGDFNATEVLWLFELDGFHRNISVPESVAQRAASEQASSQREGERCSNRCRSAAGLARELPGVNRRKALCQRPRH